MVRIIIITVHFSTLSQVIFTEIHINEYELFGKRHQRDAKRCQKFRYILTNSSLLYLQLLTKPTPHTLKRISTCLLPSEA